MKSQSRQARFDETMVLVENAKETIEELQTELQNWLDAIPENLQGGQKAESLQAAIEELESLAAALEEAAGTTVEFPGMCG